jgi:type II secretory pathway component PulF
VSAEKIIGAEDESTATPVPERVLLSLLHFFPTWTAICLLYFLVYVICLQLT